MHVPFGKHRVEEGLAFEPNLRRCPARVCHTRADQQRQKARIEIAIGNAAARAAKSGAVAARVRVLRPGVFCPGKGRGRGASGRMCRAGFGGRVLKADVGAPARAWEQLTHRTLTMGLEYFIAISGVGGVRFGVGFIAQPRHHPPKRCSTPPLA